MNKMALFVAVMAAVGLSNTAMADEHMEKCSVVKDGKGLIKAHQGDCKGANHSCAGQNVAGDPNAWIVVPKGSCTKINAGDFTGVSQTIRNKIEGGEGNKS